MTEQEKQPYKDRYDAEMKRFTDWGDSEEGRKNLQERHELIRKCKAAGMEELHKAVGVLPGQPKSSPTKHADGAEETPVKQRRVVSARPQPMAAETILDDRVVE